MQNCDNNHLIVFFLEFVLSICQKSHSLFHSIWFVDDFIIVSTPVQRMNSDFNVQQALLPRITYKNNQK